MKSRIIILLVLITLLAPLFSRAVVPGPVASLSVTVNTEGEDGEFCYGHDFFYSEGNQWWFDDRFCLTTENFTASEIYFPIRPEQYRILQWTISGVRPSNIVCTSDNPAQTFTYETYGVIIGVPVVGEKIACTFDNFKKKTPILIVPGLTGTEMKKGDEKLWLDLGRMAVDFGDEFLDPLEFNADLTPKDSEVSISDIVGKKTVGPVTFDYTDGLINEFKNQGYVENENLFTFPYDWRYGLSVSLENGESNETLLAKKIDDIMTQTGAEKVDVVAHSLGGLIVKSYVADYFMGSHIGKAVFVGVPNTGAPKAIKALLQGDNFGIPWLADSEMKKIAANLPASYDLLPNLNYFNVKGSFVKTIDVADVTLENPSVQNTIKDLNYEETKSFLTADHGLNYDGIANAENFHTPYLDDFDLRTAGVDVYNIVGCKAGTLGKIVEERKNGLFGKAIFYRPSKEIPGDGTVPLESATNLLVDESHKYYSLEGSHSKMMSQNGTRQEIVNILAGSSLEVSDSLITQDISKCQLNGKAIAVYSPVNITVTDQNGNKIGVASDGSLQNEIANADYEVLGDHTFIYLPTDNGQVYTIGLTGTENGNFTITIGEIQNNQTTGTQVFSNLPSTAELTGSIVLNPGNASELKVKQNSGAEEQAVLADAVLDPGQENDYFTPQSSATLSGEKDESENYKTEVTVSIKSVEPSISSEETSGLLNVQYNLDNKGFEKVLGDVAEFKVLEEGSHTVAFFSIDRAGNIEQTKTKSFEIKLPQPEAPLPATPEPQTQSATGASVFPITTAPMVAPPPVAVAPPPLVAVVPPPPVVVAEPLPVVLPPEPVIPEPIIEQPVRVENIAPVVAVNYEEPEEKTVQPLPEDPASEVKQPNPYVASVGGSGYLLGNNLWWLIILLIIIVLFFIARAIVRKVKEENNNVA